MVVVIGVDRLWAVAWPLHYRTHRSHRNLAASLAISWLYSCLTVLPTLVHDKLAMQYNVTVCDVSVKENYYFWRGTISMGFLAPAAGVLIVYSLIAGKLVAHIRGKRRAVTDNAAISPVRLT